MAYKDRRIRLKAFLLHFSPCAAVFATFFSLWGGGGGFISSFEGISSTFFPCRSLFVTFFSLGGGGAFALLLLFSLCGGLFCYAFLLMRSLFRHVGAFLLRFFSMWGCCFCFYGDPFLLAPHTKI